MSIYLGIDVGTSSVKTIAVDERGVVLASASASYPMEQPKPGYAQQDPEDWWKGTLLAVHDVACQLGGRAKEIRGIGLSGQMHSLVLLDAAGHCLRPAILWCDQRTEEECAQITERLGAERLREWTGNRALTGFTLPKLLWVRKWERDVFGQVQKALLPKDYIRYRLTGEFATEVSDASGTLLFDVRKRAWSEEMLSAFDIPGEWMPRVVESKDVTGVVRSDVARECGLPENVIVVGGGGDQAAGAVGTGTIAQGDVSVAVGTSGVVFAALPQYDVDDQCRLHTFCHAVPDTWHTMGVMLSATGSLDWWMEAVGHPEQAEAKKSGENPYELLCRPAQSVKPGSEGLLFLPYLMGERTPHPDPNARGGFVGLRASHTKAHMTRAVLEGVAFGLRDSLELMLNLGTKADRVRVTGGGAKSAVWRQIIADVMNRPVVTVSSSEGPAFGVALLAAVADGAYGSVDEACNAAIVFTSTTEPSKARSIYDDCYAVYTTLYSQLSASFRSLSALASR